MNAGGEPGVTIRTAVAADLPGLQHVYRAASLSNVGDAPLLLAQPEFLIFAGEAVTAGGTLAAVTGQPGMDRIVGFATVVAGPNGDAELEDLFVDPDWRRRGIARDLVREIGTLARRRGHRRMWVTGNPHALDFYLAVGFVHTGEASTALGAGLRLTLDLDQTF